VNGFAALGISWFINTNQVDLVSAENPNRVSISGGSIFCTCPVTEFSGITFFL